MQDSIQKQILSALLVALRPLARALLRAGIGHREFNEISKTAFVSVATKDYGLRGRPTNISRVAVMTGLTRKEVKRLRDKAAAGKETQVLRTNPMADILHRWHTDEGFVTGSGMPKELSFDGPGITFATLVRKYGGDIPPGAMRTELKRIKALEETQGGKLKVLKRAVSGLDVHERLITGLATAVYPAALAIAHNTNADETWIQRLVATKFVRDTDVGRLRRISSDRLVEFTESIDDLFVAYETLYEKESEQDSPLSVGMSVIYFEEDKSEADVFT